MNPLDVVEIKQTFAGLAELLAAYVHELQAQGFKRREALLIAIAWQAAVVSGPHLPDEEEGGDEH